MKKIRLFIILSFTTFFLASCDDFLNVNVDPDSPSAVPADQLLPTIMFYAAQINYDNAEYGVYLSQCLTTGGRAQVSGYGYKAGWSLLSMNRHPQWRRHFYDVGKNVYEMRKAANLSGGQENYIAIGRVVNLMSAQLTTDVFGAMPMTEAYLSVSPKYDSQEQVYDWLLNESNELISYLDDPSVNQPTKLISKKQDRIFSGDVQKWKNVVYALKARILLRNLPNINTSDAICNEIINTAELALASWEEPKYNYDGGDVKERNNPWGSVQPVINSWESRANFLTESIPSKFFMVNMLRYEEDKDTARMADNFTLDNFKDPRIPYLMDKRGDKSSPVKFKYRFLENNYGKDASLDYVNFPDLYSCVLTQNNSFISLFPTSELHFIIAEAAYWKGDKEKSVAALNEGIRTNMRMLGVPESKINTYLDPASQLVPGTSNITIADIMREKYIAMYLQPEQWTDMRRYGYSNKDSKKFGRPGEEVIVYPGLRRPYNLYVGYWDITKTDEWVQRLNYDPETEEKYNRNELIRLGAFDEALNSANPNWLRKPMIWAPQN
jgi:hypothetical protein